MQIFKISTSGNKSPRRDALNARAIYTGRRRQLRSESGVEPIETTTYSPPQFARETEEDRRFRHEHQIYYPEETGFPFLSREWREQYELEQNFTDELLQRDYYARRCRLSLDEVTPHWIRTKARLRELYFGLTAIRKSMYKKLRSFMIQIGQRTEIGLESLSFRRSLLEEVLQRKQCVICSKQR
ncbi:uncharacterized protein LOC142340809 isoform X2 [Convolutriloba macropyga]|uniref:uncharacterized protein LOC142340809 isoform X2 n=1 Tax=Convolutriloba macropyga TaxID=536237 RepID=UPI003F51E357